MPAMFNARGNRQTYPSKPSGTSAVTIYTCANVRSSTLEAINIATKQAVIVSVIVNDGTTDYDLFPAVSLPANIQLLHHFGNVVLLKGWSVKVQTSVASQVSFVLTVAEEFNNDEEVL
jgi:hypothetical protein